jgi:large subunit ribosomal protein L15e
MGFYKYLKEIMQKESKKKDSMYKQRLMKFRREPATIRLDRPTRLDRARALGYKAKEGFIVVRQRVSKGGHTRPYVAGGRRPRHSGYRKNMKISYQLISEMRAAKKFKNCEVLNSYLIAEDGKHKWFEIILVDKTSPAIQKDKNMKWICSKKHTNRAFRGLTSSARKSRGLRHKGKGAEKMRPSLNANKGRGN